MAVQGAGYIEQWCKNTQCLDGIRWLYCKFYFSERIGTFDRKKLCFAQNIENMFELVKVTCLEINLQKVFVVDSTTDFGSAGLKH